MQLVDITSRVSCTSQVKLSLKQLSRHVLQALPVPPILDMVICYTGAFLGILWVAGCAHALDNQLHERLLVASLGATAVLLYGVMESKLAQPRNVIGKTAGLPAHHWWSRLPVSL